MTLENLQLSNVECSLEFEHVVTRDY